MLKKIYILIIIVLSIAVLTTGLVASQVVSHLNDRNNKSYLLAAARTVQQGLADGLDPDQASARAIRIFSQGEDRFRVTVIERTGLVLFDSEADQGQMENHLFRPEVSFALQNRSIGTAVRISNTLNVSML